MTEEIKKSKKKESFEIAKKTADAQGTTSEEAATKEAEKVEEQTEKMIEKIDKEEEKKDEEDKKKAIEKIDKDEADAKEKKEKPITKKWSREKEREEKERAALAAWEPKTKLGQEVKDKKITKINEILESNKKILEPEIIDSLINVKSDLVAIGQSKGKFGGGKRRAWRQTQRKTKEGNVPTFSTMAVVGDGNGHIGIGTGKAKETLPARDKAIRKAKLNLVKIKRDCAGFDCACSESHTVPFEVTGKAGSVVVKLIPAPQGTGLVVGNELKKILKMAGIKDVYSRTSGRKRTSFNLIKACISALKNTNK